MTSDVLARLLAPGPCPKRVSLQYRPLPAQAAAATLDSEVRAAEFRHEYSRRTRRVLNRALGSEGIQVRVRLARYSAFDPDHWWQTRNGQRVAAVEMQKLLLDLTRHPF